MLAVGAAKARESYHARRWERSVQGFTAIRRPPLVDGFAKDRRIATGNDPKLGVYISIGALREMGEVIGQPETRECPNLQIDGNLEPLPVRPGKDPAAVPGQ